ncbi:MAG: hypothetical protein L3J83_08130 [Proteobacteria bacterium]|nr:hypothetical protein [Pseudomonadota bacterium]
MAKYAEPESLQIKCANKIYDYVIVVPICNESNDCLDNIFSRTFSSTTENILIIAVVNSPVNKVEWQDANHVFIHHLLEKSTRKTLISKPCQLLEFTNDNDVLLVDKNSAGMQIHADHGVGLARKIGCDIALKYYTHGIIKYPWIYSTDADVILPKNYFSGAINDCGDNDCKDSDCEERSAIVLEFDHISDDQRLNQLQFCYDFKLRYYHAGITYAGTSYDYIPLGSTLIINMKCYAQVRGFPKRNAGEDFYLLNKLAKIKPIKYLVDGLVVKIKSRFSNRVPFGTGPALLKINKLPSLDTYRYYHPNCFIELKKWISYLQNLWSDNQLNIKCPADKNLQDLYDYLSCEVVFEKSQAQITSANRWQQFIHQWFDAFKVLKAVHFFDKKYARLNYLELLKTDSFDKVLNSQLISIIKKND